MYCVEGPRQARRRKSCVHCVLPTPTNSLTSAQLPVVRVSVKLGPCHTSPSGSPPGSNSYAPHTLRRGGAGRGGRRRGRGRCWGSGAAPALPCAPPSERRGLGGRPHRPAGLLPVAQHLRHLLQPLRHLELERLALVEDEVDAGVLRRGRQARRRAVWRAARRSRARGQGSLPAGPALRLLLDPGGPAGRPGRPAHLELGGKVLQVGALGLHQLRQPLQVAQQRGAPGARLARDAPQQRRQVQAQAARLAAHRPARPAARCRRGRLALLRQRGGAPGPGQPLSGAAWPAAAAAAGGRRGRLPHLIPPARGGAPHLRGLAGRGAQPQEALEVQVYVAVRLHAQVLPQQPPRPAHHLLSQLAQGRVAQLAQQLIGGPCSGGSGGWVLEFGRGTRGVLHGTPQGRAQAGAANLCLPGW
jgi:hypothetical protein